MYLVISLQFVYDVAMTEHKPNPGLRAKKSLGQHFLNSPSALKKIIAAAKLSADEVVLEIGPGTGILTEALLKTGVKVIAIEKDARACDVLTGRFSSEISEKRLILKVGDVLEGEMVTANDVGHKIVDGNYVIVANIPYYITGAILEKFLEYSPRPNRMILLVQKEVAERIVARDKKESILSISIKAFGTPYVVTIVPRGAFVPAPNVDSAVLAIEDISVNRFSGMSSKQPAEDEIKRFFDIVHAGFAHKRKYARRNLERVCDHLKLDTIWKNLSLDGKIRSEDMVMEDWINITKGIK